MGVGESGAMRDSEERFLQGLSDLTFEGIAISEGGRVLEVNQAFLEMFDYGASESSACTRWTSRHPNLARPSYGTPPRTRPSRTKPCLSEKTAPRSIRKYEDEVRVSRSSRQDNRPARHHG